MIAVLLSVVSLVFTDMEILIYRSIIPTVAVAV